MSKIKNIFNSLLLCFCLLGGSTLGLALQASPKEDNSTPAKAELADYIPVTNDMPEFVKLSNAARDSSNDLVYLMANSSTFDLSIASGENNLVDGTGDNTGKQNFAYIPSSPLNTPENPNTEYYYFDFANSLSLYYNVSNNDIINGSNEQLDNLLSGQDINLFSSTNEGSAFPIPTYDITPEKLEVRFMLNTANSSIQITNKTASSPAIVTLPDEGCYTLALPLTFYYTTDGGQTFSVKTDTYYYTFFVFEYTTYFDSATTLPVSTMSNTTTSSLTNSDTHSTYYFYNYNTNRLPAFTYNPFRQQIALHYIDTDSTPYDAIIEFDPTTNSVTQKDANGNVIAEDFVMASYNSTLQELTLTFNGLGEYDLSFSFLYVSDGKIYTLPLTAKRQRLYNYGYQSFYTDYSKIDPDTHTTIPQEFKQISEDKTSFINSADITYTLNAPQHQQAVYDIDSLKNNAVTAIQSGSQIKPVSTNQTPVKFASNVTVVNAKKYNVTLNSNNEFQSIDNGVAFDGLNINESGTYLIIIDYQYSKYLSASGTVQGTFHHYQAFYFTVENKTPSVTILDEAGKEIRTKGFTNKSVYILDDSASTLYDAQVTITLSAKDYVTDRYYFENVNIKDFASPHYGISYFTNENVTGMTLPQTGVFIDASTANEYRNAQFTIRIYSTNSQIPSSSSFTIDTNSITNLNARNVKFSTSSTYSIGSTVDGGKTNSPIIFSWDNKASGATTYGYYKYFELKNAPYYSGDDSLLLYSLIGSATAPQMLPVNAVLDLNSSANQWTNYVNSNGYTSTIPSTYVRDQAGVYIFEVYDIAGNSSFEIFLIDNTSPLFVKTIESARSTERSILSTNDTITVSPSYTASIEWGNSKGIYLTPLNATGESNLYKSYAYDGLDKDENGRVTTLTNKIDSFLGSDNTISLSGITINPPNRDLIPSYNAKYLKINVAHNYFFKDADKSTYEERKGNKYEIDFGITSDNEAKEGTYQFLLRDESNSNFTDNEYGFLNYPSNFLSINVTSDSSRLDVLLKGQPLKREGYSLSGNFYEFSDVNGMIYSKTDDSTEENKYTQSDLTYRYAYFVPVKTEDTLTVTYIPVSRTENTVSRVKNVKIDYYAYVKTPKEVTYYKQDGTPYKAVAYYYTLSPTVTRTINIFNYSASETYQEGVPNTFPLSFSGTGMASEGKYVISRTYFEDASNIYSYDYYERSLTLLVDRKNVLSMQESVTNEVKNEETGEIIKTSTSLESIVGGDMLVTMYNEIGQSSIQVAFPTYNPETGLNTGSFFTKGVMDEDTIITTKLTTNKLPLSVKIPKFKYTENYVYDPTTNSYSVINNNVLSKFGNGRIESFMDGGFEFFNVIVEGVVAETFDSREEAEAYLATTEITEYKLHSIIRFTSNKNNVTKYYKTNGLTNGEYLNFYEVSSIDAPVPAGVEPVFFTEAGIYDVTIYQAYNNANIQDSFRNFYRFAFEVLEPEPDFTVLSAEKEIEINSKIIDNAEYYYTNSQTIIIQWQDSDDPYIANLDKNPDVIYIVKDDGSRVYLDRSAIKTNGLVNSITLDLGPNGLNIWSNNRSISIEMQLEGHSKYYKQVKKYVYVDYSAPVENLAELMNGIENTTTLFDRIYQETKSRELLDFNGNPVNTDLWFNSNLINDYMANVSYSYSAKSGEMKYYAYNVSKDFFLKLKSNLQLNSINPTTSQNIYYSLIGNIENYLKDYTQVEANNFSSLNYNNILDIELDYDNLTAGNYYEIVETDTAGNMVVYIVHIYDPENADNIALSYTSTIRGDDEANILDSEIINNHNIYSSTGFELLALDYLTDSWGIYRTNVYGVANTYMKSPWLMLDSQLEFHPEITDLYRVRYEGGRLVFTPVTLSELFEYVTHSSLKHSITFTDRYNGNNTNILVSIMDESIITNKHSDSTTAILDILGVPTTEDANSLTNAFIFPVRIEIYQFITSVSGNEWVKISDETNLSGNPNAWVSPNPSIKYSYVGGNLSITVALNTLNGNNNNTIKLKYDITDNFAKTTSITQVANEEEFSIVLGNSTIYPEDKPKVESDGSYTYTSSDDMSFQYNRLLDLVEVERYDHNTNQFIRMTNNEIYSGTLPGTSTITSIRFSKGTGNYDRIYRIKIYHIEDYEEGISDPYDVYNLRIYYRLPQTLTSPQNPEDTSNIWFLDKNNEYIKTFGTINNETVVMNGKVYTANSSTINTYSNNLTIFFDNGQFGDNNNTLSYLNEYSYSVYLSIDGSSWLNINEFYASGYRITGSGNYKVLIVYDDEIYFSNMCKIYDITILDSSSVFYYITVDGNLVEKADIKYTDPSGRQYSENYIVGVNYLNDKSDRVSVVGNDELGINPVLYRTYPTGTNVYVEVYYYSSSISSGYFTIIYIYLRDTDNLLTFLNYEDASASPIPLLGKTSETIVADETEEDFSRLKISWTDHYGIEENTVNIEVLKLFNNVYQKVEVDVYSNGTTRYAYLTRSGTYRLRFYDSCSPVNEQRFGNGKYLNLVFLNSVPFTVTYTDPATQEEIVTEPINRAVYNGEVKLSLANLSSYFQTSGYPTNKDLYKDSVMITKDGVEYNNYTLSNYVFTFKETGYYAVRFKAISLNGISIRQESYAFSIINDKESRYAYEFAPYANYYIEKVVKDGRDITSILVNLAGNDTIMINGEKHLSKLLVSYFDERTGAGRYTITINTGEQSYASITATTFTFGFWINLATPPISVSINEGESTTDNITIRFNAYNLHDTIGDCYIKISTDRYNINAETLETIGGENATITITQSGTYYIQIYSTSNILLYSYKVSKTDPLNTWAIIAIVFGVIAAIAITFITIKLRKRLKVK